jgi:hypothetical protein
MLKKNGEYGASKLEQFITNDKGSANYARDLTDKLIDKRLKFE